MLLWEYPGYGIAPGKPNAPVIRRDMQIVYRFVTEFLQVPPKNVILFGRSIGATLSQLSP